MDKNNKLQVEAIRCGTVIDHIPARIGIKLLSMFKLASTDERITIGLNLPSNKQGKKDIIKLENIFLNQEQANQLAIYSPYATINHINDYYVIHKQMLTLPKYIYGILICPNTNCISRIELIPSEFTILLHTKEIYLQCVFCEKLFKRYVVNYYT